MAEPIIVKKIEDMIDYGYKAVKHFPKSERHVLSQEIRLSMWSLLRLSVTCWKRYHKKTTLNDLDIELDTLRRLIRTAMQLGFLPFSKYEIWSRHLAEIGKIIGSWISKLSTKG